MASLSLTNVCKVYPNGFEAVKDFNLEVEDQEFIRQESSLKFDPMQWCVLLHDPKYLMPQ